MSKDGYKNKDNMTDVVGILSNKPVASSDNKPQSGQVVAQDGSVITLGNGNSRNTK